MRSTTSKVILSPVDRTKLATFSNIDSPSRMDPCAASAIRVNPTSLNAKPSNVHIFCNCSKIVSNDIGRN